MSADIIALVPAFVPAISIPEQAIGTLSFTSSQEITARVILPTDSFQTRVERRMAEQPYQERLKRIGQFVYLILNHHKRNLANGSLHPVDDGNIDYALWAYNEARNR